MDATEQVAPIVEVPAHLVAAAEPKGPTPPGHCPRCGESRSTRLMRSDRVEYRLCEDCGRVWVERCAYAARLARVAPIAEAFATRVWAVVSAAVRFMTAQQA